MPRRCAGAYPLPGARCVLLAPPSGSPSRRAWRTGASPWWRCSKAWWRTRQGQPVQACPTGGSKLSRFRREMRGLELWLLLQECSLHWTCNEEAQESFCSNLSTPQISQCEEELSFFLKKGRKRHAHCACLNGRDASALNGQLRGAHTARCCVGPR